MKYIVLLGDGMSDYPLESRDNKTPLQISRTPTLDMLAAQGELGLAATIPEGMDPGSDVANMSVMGYDPEVYYSGRAPVEAASIGVDLGPEDIAFRCNLVTLREQSGSLIMDDYSAGHISTEEASQLIADIRQHLESGSIAFYPGVSYRHLMVWRQGVDGIKTVPPHDISGREIDQHLPLGAGSEIIREVMGKSREVLAASQVNRDRISRGEKPATSVWLWGQGRKLTLPAFRDLYGVSGSVISAVDLMKGLGICAGLRAIDVPGATGYLDTNYEGKVSAALDALEQDDFVYLHVEAPDEASHKGSLEEKIQAIEEFDGRIVGPVLDGLRKRFEHFRLMVLPDHPTPLCIKTHASDPVPFIICSSADLVQQPSAQRCYSEQDARAAGLFIPDGYTLMNRLIKS